MPTLLAEAGYLAADPRITEPVTVVDGGGRTVDEVAWPFRADQPGLLDEAVCSPPR